MTNGTLGVGPVTTLPKNTLASNRAIKDFYLNIVSKKPEFYNDFFNLVRIKPTATDPAAGNNVPLNEAENLTSDADLAKYRLNVKKVQGQSALMGAQLGGAYGDIYLIILIPLLTPIIKGIWISRIKRLTRAQLNIGDEAIRQIVRDVYAAPPGNTVTVLGVPIQLFDVINRASKGLFDLDYEKEFRRIIDKALLGKMPGMTSVWKENEERLFKHMAAENSRWRRDEDKFVKLAADGKTIVEEKITDNCNLIKTSSKDCLDFIASCVDAESKTFPAACAKLLEFDFDINTAINELAEKVKEINPSAAYGILRNFGFGYYLGTDDVPIRGFKRYKVESVSSWLKELLTGTPECPTKKQPEPECLTLKEFFKAQPGVLEKLNAMARDSTKWSFFNYLDALVQWVNANPQVLNKEETRCLGVEGKQYPKIDKSFMTYDYLSPYKKAELRMRDLTCGMERLKVSIMEGLTGAQGANIISAVTSVPYGIQMPLGRPGFTNPLPLSNYFPMQMYGGGNSQIELELQAINSQYGYQMFSQVYTDITKTMESLKGDKKMCLSNTSKTSIQEKLERFKKCEEDLRKDLVKFVEQNKLYQASHGYINPYEKMDDAEYKALMAKHSNLLYQSKRYNKGAMNMIDMLQTIANAILGKLENKTETTTTQITRPLTAQYHSFTKKN